MLFKQSKKYLVNNISLDGLDVKYGQRIIGLFRGGFCKGTGSFSGWYAQEYMCNTVLLGYFIIESSHTIDKGKEHLKEVRLDKPKRFKRLIINSLYTQYMFSAPNDQEALSMFFAEKWNEDDKVVFMRRKRNDKIHSRKM